MAGHSDHDGAQGFDAAVEGAAHEGCRESRLLLSRRSMLGVTAALFSTAFLPDFSLAATNSKARVLVVILRGGMDGIGMVIPKLDPNYVTMRKQLALPFSATLSLGSDFALHPSLPNVHAMFLGGDATIAPAAGIPLRSRSHFECQDNLENGLPVNTANATGWLNRLFGALPAGDPVRVRHGLEIGEAPLILRGPEPVLGWSPTWFDKSDPATVSRLETVYTTLDPPLWSSLKRGLDTDALALASGAGSSGNISTLRKGFIGAARLMRAATGPRISVLSVEGWDTHSQQGALTGAFSDRLRDLDEALGDFKTELGGAWANTVAICVTEFGRTVRTNGDGGTDHGVGTVALMAGGALNGGIVGDWPGIAANQLYEGSDLRPTVDLRSLFKGVLRDHVGVPQSVLDTTVFPGSVAAPPTAGLITVPVVAPLSAARYPVPPTLQDVAPIALYRQQYGT